MSDKKISALTAASTPLAGTEVLPIVQGGATVKVPSDDLTVKNVRSNATSGVLQIAGPAAASTRVMTVPNQNFSAARTDSANFFTGDQALVTGSLLVQAAGSGFDFSGVTPAAGMTSRLLDWYEEGTWTPSDASGASLSLSNADGGYVRIGRLVVAYCRVSYPVTANGDAAAIGGLPFSIENSQKARQANITYTTQSTATFLFPIPNAAYAIFFNSAGAVTNAQMSGSDNWLSFTYPV